MLQFSEPRFPLSRNEVRIAKRAIVQTLVLRDSPHCTITARCKVKSAMENEEGDYEPIDDSALKPFTTRSLATIFSVVAVTSVGVFCALFFTIGGISSSTKPDIPPLVDNHHVIGGPLGCSTIPSTSTGLQCAYYNSSSSWFCLDQDEPSLLMDMTFLEKLSTAEENLLAVAKEETKDTLLCSASGSLWVCLFLTSLQSVGAEITSTFNPNDLLCTRTQHSDWMCWKSDQDITFSNIATLSSTLLPTYRADHTIGCLLNTDGTWECGELYNCVYQRKLGWACWGGNVTTTTVSSVPWFTETRERLLKAELTHRESLNVTDQMCYYHPKQGRYRCASSEVEADLQEVAFFNGSLKATFQCAYAAGEWICLRDLAVQDVSTLQTFQSCVHTTVAVEPDGTDDNEASLMMAYAAPSKRKTPSDPETVKDSAIDSRANSVENGDAKANLPYAVDKTAATSSVGQERRSLLRQGTPPFTSAAQSPLLQAEASQALSQRSLLAPGQNMQVSVRCIKLPTEWACSFINYSEI